VACGKIFTNPVKVSNIKISAVPYDACPYCLTEIKNTETICKQVAKENIHNSEAQSQNAVYEKSQSACKKHFGYLGERDADVKIPDDCLTCKDIVQCMLKKTQL
jgi:predicted amidophosphoribosyltransferase